MSSKMFCRIILQRLSDAVNTILRQEQAGFCKRRSCTDQIFILHQILEQSQEWNASFYAVFVDFEKAFRSLQIESLWRNLCHYGLPEKLVNVIKALFVDFECKVIHDNHLTESFNVNTGVKQGCILPPL